MKPDKQSIKNLTVVYKSDKGLSGDERLQMSRLHFRHGRMWPTFMSCFGESEMKIALAKVGPKITGWGLCINIDQKKPTVHLYVNSKFRRAGIGSKIFQKLRKHYRRIQIEPHDEASPAFLEKMGYPIKK